MLRSLPLVMGLSAALAALAACAPAPCCVDDESCGEGLGCFDGRCSYTCASDHDCAPSEICARPADGRAPGVCVAPGEDEGECRERVAPVARDGGVQEDAGPPPRDAGGDAGGPPRDAGPPRDGGDHDAGRLDAGAPDAGFDAGALDGGAPFDAGPLDDAGADPDAGFDAGPFDAGAPDAGFDAGQPDAGSPDAGFDAGPGECADDPFENNDDRPSATVLDADVTTLTAVACPDDPDLYQVPVASGETITIALGYDAPPGMRLTVSRQGQGVLGTSATGSGLEQVSFQALTSGFALVRVAAVATESARPYGLVIDRSSNAACQDDALEPNDSQQQATELPFPADISARVCTPDPDFFELQPQNVSSITVDLVENPDTGLIVTVLRRPSFSILAVISASSGPTVVNLGTAQGNRLIFVVAGAGDADYTLTIE